ncbi:hypothetical protein HNV11_08400 [Spirosoma taeanense]|uniref:Uncharacterized protein n=1 Tax=Spirosoma taeanense TaxID=2735870 RepID=A0A6M5Y892_9BACT|nr:hypothetical protein [Spirosoma taeanense]QJW89403.1 hypothetical protein HNV11_08400 [Spirosoma taeanense]
MKQDLSKFSAEYSRLVEQEKQIAQQLELQRQESGKALELMNGKQEEAQAQLKNLYASLDSIKKQNQELVAKLESTKDKATELSRQVQRAASMMEQPAARTPQQQERFRRVQPN